MCAFVELIDTWQSFQNVFACILLLDLMKTG